LVVYHPVPGCTRVFQGVSPRVRACQGVSPHTGTHTLLIIQNIKPGFVMYLNPKTFVSRKTWAPALQHHYNFARNATLYIFARIHPGKLRWNQPVITFILRTC
jgi:hypothetical protein